MVTNTTNTMFVICKYGKG